MQFRDIVITNAGQAVFARAAAQRGLILWENVVYSSTNLEPQTLDELRTLATLSSVSATGIVTSSIASYENATCTLHTESTNTTNNGYLRAFGIYARVKGEDTNVLAIVGRTGGATASYLNAASGGLVRLFLDVSIHFSDYAATAVQIDASNYAQAGALAATNAVLEDISSRVVTTHRAGDEETGEAQIVRGMKSFEDGLKAQEAEVLSIKNAKAECGKIFPTSDGTDIVITAINESRPYTNTVQILSGITDESESAIREVLLMFEETGSLTLTNDPKKEAYTPPGIVSGRVSAITLNCTITKAKSIIGTSGEKFTYTVQNNTTIGNPTRHFGALYADNVNGTLNMATGVLASLYRNEKGALLEITITGSLNATQARETNGILPRGAIIRNGHYYDTTGAEDPDTDVVPPLIAVTITCESMIITNNMRFALLKRTEINIPANTLDATVTTWAIRVE